MDLGAYHPPIVHFAVALLVVGVAFRCLSFLPRCAFADRGATLLLLGGTVAALLAVTSGVDAHGPAEQIPGAGRAVHEHEEWGERVRNVFLLVGLLEIGALVGRARIKVARGLLIGSAALGLGGLFVVYEAAAHGGEVVYAYAGGVGTRHGNPEHVERLLRAGLFHQARLDREQRRSEAAARLFQQLSERAPGDPEVALLRAESLLRDLKDAPASLAALDALPPPGENRRARFWAAMLRVDVLVALGRVDEARKVLEELRAAFPGSSRVEERARSLAKEPGQ